LLVGLLGLYAEGLRRRERRHARDVEVAQKITGRTAPGNAGVDGSEAWVLVISGETVVVNAVTGAFSVMESARRNRGETVLMVKRMYPQVQDGEKEDDEDAGDSFSIRYRIHARCLSVHRVKG
jgi:hypothetical protein